MPFNLPSYETQQEILEKVTDLVNYEDYYPISKLGTVTSNPSAWVILTEITGEGVIDNAYVFGGTTAPAKVTVTLEVDGKIIVSKILEDANIYGGVVQMNSFMSARELITPSASNITTNVSGFGDGFPTSERKGISILSRPIKFKNKFVMKIMGGTASHGYLMTGGVHIA